MQNPEDFPTEENLLTKLQGADTPDSFRKRFKKAKPVSIAHLNAIQERSELRTDECTSCVGRVNVHPYPLCIACGKKKKEKDVPNHCNCNITEVCVVWNQTKGQTEGHFYSHMGPSSVMLSNAHDEVVPSVAHNWREETL